MEKVCSSNWLSRDEADSPASTAEPVGRSAVIADDAVFHSFLGDAIVTITVCFGFRHLSTRTGVMGSWEVEFT